MSVWAIATVRDEADIVASTIQHLINHGIENFLIVDHDSADDTRSILDSFPQVVILEDHEPIHHHALRMSQLAEIAGDAGATWIVPFDADEFWCTTSGRPIGDVLMAQPPEVDRLPAVMYQYVDMRMREPSAKPLPKMAFRYQPGVIVHYGNHDVDGLRGVMAHGELEVREIQYRNAGHFCEKIAARLATLDPEMGPGIAAHIRQYADRSRAQLEEEWHRLVARATVDDPIPTAVTL